MRGYAAILVSSICGLLAFSGCGNRQAAGTGPALSPGCVVLARPQSHSDTIRIALPGRADPQHAPVPRNESERILFGHLYETLITVDCEGKVHPRLASGWQKSEGGSRWTFELRRDARFWDGSPVTPYDIESCWESLEIEPLVWAAGVDSIAVAGERMVHIYFKDPHEELPLELSALPFNVAKIGPRNRWPLGSASCHIESESVWSSRTYSLPFTVSPVPGTKGPVLLFFEPGSLESFDSRDLLEGSVDVMITGDPDVIEYASSRPHLEIIPLPWTRIYILLSTTRALDIRIGGSPAGIDQEFTDDLARDAVPGIARGHQSRDWWDRFYLCAPSAYGVGWRPSPKLSANTPENPRRIIFDEDDPVARGLAERIVALGAAGPHSSPEATRLAAAIPGLEENPGGLTASGTSEEELSMSLEEGKEFAYVIWLPLHPPDPCTGIMQLVKRAKWLSQLGDDLAGGLLPLVDTRRYAIVRRDTAGLVTDWYGNLYITGALSGAATPRERM